MTQYLSAHHGSSIINSRLGWLPAPRMVALFRLKCKQQEDCFLKWKIL